jgi:hypothetical protein
VRVQPGWLGLSLWLALGVAQAASLEDAVELAADGSIPPDRAALLLNLEVPRATHSAVVRIWEWHLIIHHLDSGTRYRLVDASQPRLYLLPPGRYYAVVARNSNLDEVERVTRKQQWFELRAGNIHYAGKWSIAGIAPVAGNDSLSVAFAREPLDALIASHPAVFEAHALWLSPIGQESRPLKSGK